MRVGDSAGKTVDMTANLLGAEADGGKRILDLVGYTPGYFFPRGLLLRAEQFGSIFKHDDVALMLAAHAFGGGGHLEQSNRSQEVHRSAKSVVGRREPAL